MSAAHLTDQDIEQIVARNPFVQMIRNDLYEKRQRDRAEILMRQNEERLQKEAILAAQRAEEEQTDAGKADRMVGLTLRVDADRMVGKTSLLLLLLDALADQGLLSAAATRDLTRDPLGFLCLNRSLDDADCEAIEIDIDMNAVFEILRR